MRKILFLCLFTVGALHGSDTDELDKLRASYKTAVDKALKPLNQTYLDELEKLRSVYTRAGKLDAAVAAQAEIDAIHQGASGGTTPKSGAGGAAPEAKPAGVTTGKMEKQPETRWFLGKVWATAGGSRWVFDKTGNAGQKLKGTEKVGTITWMIVDSGVMEVTETIGGRTGKTFIRFKDRSEAMAGSSPSPDALTIKLHVE